MNSQLRVGILWIFPAMALVAHTALEISAFIFFTKDADMSEFPDEIPTEVHIVYIVALILPLFISLTTFFTAKKSFRWFSLIYASLLLIINTLHLVETVIGNISNISQVLLLAFIVFANLYLLLQINKWRKEQEQVNS